jgi:hypothetical protein
MIRVLITLLLLLACPVGAADWRSELYGCAWNMPAGEPWQENPAQKVAQAEMIYNAMHMDTKQTVSVVLLPAMPTRDLQNPAMIQRFLQALISMGYAISDQSVKLDQKPPYIEFVGTRTDATFGELFCMARGMMRENNGFLVLTLARGNVEMAASERVQKMLDRFSFFEVIKMPEKGPDPMLQQHRLLYILSGSSAALLMIAFAVAMFFSRRRAHRR